ncbi:MAG: TlpA disulfide reductase family protein [Flavobacteriales bacterium]
MILRLFWVFSFVFLSSCSLWAQIKSPGIFDFPEFENRYFKHQNNDTLYDFNFWATWCAPCVKELPYFEKALEVYSKAPIRILLVSLDAKKKMDTQLMPFLEKRNLKNEVILLSHPNANEWIDKVSPDWSGAIPATVFMKRDQKAFYEQSFEEQELIDLIQTHLTKK